VTLQPEPLETLVPVATLVASPRQQG
jgi:hypothetical protein